MSFASPDFEQPSVWKANLAFETETGWMDTVFSAELLMTEVEAALERDPNLLHQNEVDDLEAFVDDAFDPDMWKGRDISKSAMHRKWATSIATRFVSNTSRLTAESESAAVASATPSTVMKLCRAPPAVMSVRFSMQPPTSVER